VTVSLNRLLVRVERSEHVGVLLLREGELLLLASQIERVDLRPELGVRLLGRRLVGGSGGEGLHVGLHRVSLAAQIVAGQPPCLGFDVLCLRPDDFGGCNESNLLALHVSLVALCEDGAGRLGIAVGRLLARLGATRLERARDARPKDLHLAELASLG